jgi:hypothetical protein
MKKITSDNNRFLNEAIRSLLYIIIYKLSSGKVTYLYNLYIHPVQVGNRQLSRPNSGGSCPPECINFKLNVVKSQESSLEKSALRFRTEGKGKLDAS